MGRHVGAPGVGDIVGDGILDLVVPLFNDAAFAVLHGLGDRRFSEPKRIFQDPAPWDLDLADLEGDGKADIVYTSRAFPEVYTLSSTPDTPDGFAAQHLLLKAPAGTTSWPTRLPWWWSSSTEPSVPICAWARSSRRCVWSVFGGRARRC